MADAYTGHMLLIAVVKDVHLLLEGLQDLAVSRHVSGQDQRDGALSRDHTHKLMTLVKSSQSRSQSRSQTSSVVMAPYSTAVLAYAFKAYANML